MQPSQARWGNSLSTAGSEHSADLLGLLGQVPAVQAYPDGPVPQLVQGQRHGAEVRQAAPGTDEERVSVPCLVGQGPRVDPAAGPSPASGNREARECCQGENVPASTPPSEEGRIPPAPPRWQSHSMVGTDLAFSPPDAVRVQQPLEIMREGDGIGHEGGQLAPVRFLRGGLQQLTHPLQQRLGQGREIHRLSSCQRQQLLPEGHGLCTPRGILHGTGSTATGRASHPHPHPAVTLTRGCTSSSEVKDMMKEWAIVPRTGMP